MPSTGRRGRLPTPQSSARVRVFAGVRLARPGVLRPSRTEADVGLAFVFSNIYAKFHSGLSHRTENQEAASRRIAERNGLLRALHPQTGLWLRSGVDDRLLLSPSLLTCLYEFVHVPGRPNLKDVAVRQRRMLCHELYRMIH